MSGESRGPFSDCITSHTWANPLTSRQFCKTCSNRFNGFWFNACYKNRTLGPSILSYIFKLLRKFSHYILKIDNRKTPVFKHQKSPFTSVATNSHDSELHSSTNRIGTVYTRLLTGNRMSHWCLSDANRVTWMCKDILSDSRAPGEIKWLIHPRRCSPARVRLSRSTSNLSRFSTDGTTFFACLKLVSFLFE